MEPLTSALRAYVDDRIRHAISGGPEPDPSELQRALDQHIERCVAETLVRMRQAAKIS